MSQKKIDYSKSIIYKLCCKDPLVEAIYIGSTTNMIKRKSSHKNSISKNNCKDYNTNKSNYIRENGGFDNWTIIMIEPYCCTNRNELLKRERYWIDELKPLLNTNKPIRTLEEKIEYLIKYRIDNKAELDEYLKEYRIKNKDAIKEKRTENRDKMIEYLIKYREKNPDKIRIYREKNKEKMRIYQKEYRKKLKDAKNIKLLI